MGDAQALLRDVILRLICSAKARPRSSLCAWEGFSREIRTERQISGLVNRLIQLASVGRDQRVVIAEQVEDLQRLVRQAVGVVAVADKQREQGRHAGS